MSNKEACARWREKNRERERIRSAEYNKKRDPRQYVLRNAKIRAQQKGIEFELTLDDIQVPERCPITGVVLTINKGGGPALTSPSLDRKDNTKGYVRGNVQVISQRANTLKSNMTIEEIINLYKYVTEEQ